MIAARIRIGDVSALPGYVDWAAIVTDIKVALAFDHDSEVCDLINAPRSTFRRWMNGSEPMYGYAEAVLKLHTMACGEAETQKRLAQFRERATKATF